MISPWHLHCHTKLWDNPDGFDPAHWHSDNGKAYERDAYIPFLTGRWVCIGQGFTMLEGPLFSSLLVKHLQFEAVADCCPVPVAHLTVRAQSGIQLRGSQRKIPATEQMS